MSNENKPSKTHWKKLTNPKYLGSHDLQPGQEVKITIESVSVEQVKNIDGKEEQCVVAKIKGSKKEMILNKTNMKIITKVVGSPYTEDWDGKTVILYTTKIKAFGEFMDVLRIKNEKV